MQGAGHLVCETPQLGAMVYGKMVWEAMEVEDLGNQMVCNSFCCWRYKYGTKWDILVSWSTKVSVVLWPSDLGSSTINQVLCVTSAGKGSPMISGG